MDNTEFSWENEDLEKLKNLEAVPSEHFSSLPIFKQRMEVCKSCDNLKLNFCSKCHCYMPIKTRFKISRCPIGLWTEQI
jgi:hypothetical protein